MRRAQWWRAVLRLSDTLSIPKLAYEGALRVSVGLFLPRKVISYVD
jgi:hypothetical protein